MPGGAEGFRVSAVCRLPTMSQLSWADRNLGAPVADVRQNAVVYYTTIYYKVR